MARVFLIADATGFLIPCLQDSTLKLNDPMPPQPAATAGPTGGNGSRAGGGSSKGGGGGDGGGGGGAGAPPRIFIQGNIKNNHDVMPHIVVQLLRLVLELPVDTAYVSIYESGRWVLPLACAASRLRAAMQAHRVRASLDPLTVPDG